ncbi:unnamed protein product [Closterium sp. NIES-64]|nr:unnamed protein product [Closterium sp. NIES-64]
MGARVAGIQCGPEATHALTLYILLLVLVSVVGLSLIQRVLVKALLMLAVSVPCCILRKVTRMPQNNILLSLSPFPHSRHQWRNRRWRNVRRRVFVKVLVLLAGFFSANALSTIVGQTGDWDVLVAGSLVASLELLGACLYRLRLRAASAAAADAAKLAAKSAAAAAAAVGRGGGGGGRVGAGGGVSASGTGSGGDVEGDEGVEKGEGALVDAVALVNFWKAGIILGLFVDAFKVGS